MHLWCWKLKALLTMSIPISKLRFNEQKYHMPLYWSHSIATLRLMPENASIIVHIVEENWKVFIIIHVVLDFLHYTTKVPPSVRPSQHIADMITIGLFFFNVVLVNTKWLLTMSPSSCWMSNSTNNEKPETTQSSEFLYAADFLTLTLD